MTTPDARTPPSGDPRGKDEMPAPATAISTREELEAFYTVRAILRTTVDCQRIVLRDCDNVCSVLLDADPQKPICTFRFTGNVRHVVFHDRDEPEAVSIASVADLHRHSVRLRAIASGLEQTDPTRAQATERQIMA